MYDAQGNEWAPPSLEGEPYGRSNGYWMLGYCSEAGQQWLYAWLGGSAAMAEWNTSDELVGSYAVHAWLNDTPGTGEAQGDDGPVYAYTSLNLLVPHPIEFYGDSWTFQDIITEEDPDAYPELNVHHVYNASCGDMEQLGNITIREKVWWDGTDPHR